MDLYHYTNKENLQSIQATGMLLASQTFGPHGRDAMLGEGVYLTDIPPHASTYQILKNNYGPAADRVYAHDPHIADAYVKIPSYAVNAKYAEKGDRKVFVVPTQHGINLRNIPSCDFGYRA